MHFLGKNIRYLRKKFHQTQEGIAFLVGKGQTTIGNWENGVSEPSLEDLLIISNYFGISVDAFLKTDLTLATPRMEEGQPDDRKKTPRSYDHDQEAIISMVREREIDELSPILDEIRTIREEIASIKSRLPDTP
jgi:transcriptional regulator with XRE-family HTH domain